MPKRREKKRRQKLSTTLPSGLATWGQLASSPTISFFFGLATAETKMMLMGGKREERENRGGAGSFFLTQSLSFSMPHHHLHLLHLSMQGKEEKKKGERVRTERTKKNGLLLLLFLLSFSPRVSISGAGKRGGGESSKSSILIKK